MKQEKKIKSRKDSNQKANKKILQQIGYKQKNLTKKQQAKEEKPKKKTKRDEWKTKKSKADDKLKTKGNPQGKETKNNKILLAKEKQK